MENIELTPNRMTCNAVTDENKNVLITEFKSSPKSPPAESKIEKKKLYKKKARKAFRQRKRLSSQSSERSDASQVVAAPYNLIEFYGDRSRSESVNQENVASSCNRSAGTDSAIISSGSGNLISNLQSFATCVAGDFSSTAGLSVHQTPKNVIFVIPEGWASSIEIMRLPMNLLDNSSPYVEQANSVGGPVRAKGKSYRGNRNAPYSSRRDRQGYRASTRTSRDSELTSSADRSNPRTPAFPENIHFDRYDTGDRGYKYEPRDYEKTPSSIGPIRRGSTRKAFYTPYGSAAHRRTNYNSMESASSSSTNDSYNRIDSSRNYSGGKNYQYSDNNKSIICWHCQKRGHIRFNCPSRVAQRRY